ncbi:MAG: alpha/beta fold hydrolase [Solidesulfovibrio sp.]|uniref:alpha/beta hydrolase n=1 Tax=Solidesulfovibrio sp. TaxID=2910990 RepID=UPI002B1FCD15|nr:alpha/beta fold hydrolase [Solidesulfovibrio sp.]MEA4855503.1 alpha/beta hydrolase [Solidesulfovibrio sp.]
MQRAPRLLAVVLVLALAHALFPEASMALSPSLDRPDVGRRLFHPRPEPGPIRPDRDLFAAAPDGTRLHVRLHPANAAFPTLLLFHGNGEIASDYDDLAPLLAGIGFNLAVGEFRGYGLSDGEPQASKLGPDAAVVFDFVREKLAASGAVPRLVVMGRSLGSVCALSLADARPGDLDGLVLESAFATTLPLLRVLGLEPRLLGIGEADGFGNLAKAGRFAGPTLVIHGARDDLIEAGEAKMLLAASPSPQKRLLLIPGAGHNDLFSVGRRPYLDALAGLAAQARGPGDGPPGAAPP